MLVGIYVIMNCSNLKIYVGQSTNVEDRIAHHKSSLKHNRHENSHLQRAWNKYGASNFKFRVIHVCEEDELDALERQYIQ